MGDEAAAGCLFAILAIDFVILMFGARDLAGACAVSMEVVLEEEQLELPKTNDDQRSVSIDRGPPQEHAPRKEVVVLEEAGACAVSLEIGSKF